ncbi:hypothetical protein ACC771_13765, partial [Rhizobium ruizarguesonis]
IESEIHAYLANAAQRQEYQFVLFRHNFRFFRYPKNTSPAAMGEARAALAKLSRDEMRNVAFAAGDIVVFSSRAIPGNEKAIQDIKNGLVEQGVHIITDTEA